MPFPKMLTVLQRFPDRGLPDIAGAVERELQSAGFAERVAPGASIAIGVGSRGISNIATIARAAVDYWKSKGAQPFIFPAMGSHGAATAEGQTDVLAHYGIVPSAALLKPSLSAQHAKASTLTLIATPRRATASC